MSLDTPVAFFIFNRPDLTEIVFKSIAEAKPKKLLIIADGPRNEEEEVKCNSARSVIETINWDCQLVKNYSENNLGCKKRVSSGLNWLFEQVDEAIILEDDCLPDKSFFSFCSELLNRYSQDQRIMHISGGNFLFGRIPMNYTYYFSRYAFAGYGWATWKRAWKYYDVDMECWPTLKSAGIIQNVFDDQDEQEIWLDLLDRTYDGRIDTWDFQWFLTCWIQCGLAITPTVNLVSNLGFRSDATHTNTDYENRLLSAIPRNSIKTMDHPIHVFRHAVADKITFFNYFLVHRNNATRTLATNVITKLSTIKKRLFTDIFS